MIVADTSPLIFLARVGMLPALGPLFDDVIIPPEVLDEATADLRRPGAKPIADAVSEGRLRVVPARDEEMLEQLAQSVDRGEASAIALALERDVRGVLIDDRAGRRLAEQHGLLPVGTLGVLVRAARHGLVQDASALLDSLEAAGFPMDEASRQRVEALLRLE